MLELEALSFKICLWETVCPAGTQSNANSEGSHAA